MRKEIMKVLDDYYGDSHEEDKEQIVDFLEAKDYEVLKILQADPSLNES